MSTLFGDLPMPGLSPAAVSAEVDDRGVPTWAQAGGEPPPEHAGRHTGPVLSHDPETLLEGLNPQQRAAVTHEGAPLLIVAGAGSGKTRVLAHRIAYLLAARDVRPGQILAITFTNKAAGEMRERVASLVGARTNSMWVSTFHSACVRILRREASHVGLKSTFSIYDAADSQRLMSMVMRELDLDPKRYRPRAFSAQVSNLKNELIDEETYSSGLGESTHHERMVAEAYRMYQARLRQANAMDFDDLIMTTVNILQAFPDVAEYYHRRFRHVMVDEYQDTNTAVPAGSRACRPDQHRPGGRPAGRARRRRRRGPVDLRVPRRDDPQHRRVRAGLPRRADHPARAELPLDPDHPARGQLGHRQEP